MDYSSKYGLGYLLSNGNCGVFFNDCTKIILDPTKKYFEYLERIPNRKRDKLTAWTLSNYPKYLNKKVTLLLHFRSYLEGVRVPTTYPQENAVEVQAGERPEPMVYLKK